MEELKIIQLSSALARYSTARHRVIAENVANADTPGFRARDVRPFTDYVKDSFTPRATRPGHATSDGPVSAGFRPEILTDPRTQSSGNGNSVSLEAEMVKAVEAQGRHAMAMSIYRKAHDLMRMSLGRR